MDSIINSALEEICAGGATGITVSALMAALSSTSGSSATKNAVWNRLLSIPVLRFDAGGRSLSPHDKKIQSFDESEKLGLRIVADEKLRDSFVGLDDLNAANGKISEEQRRTLERVAAARTNGITQWELSKEFGIKGNNFFYQVRNLECQQLIVRQSTTVREKGGNKVENGPKTNPIFTTNMIHLYRYAKAVNLNSQQKFEITKPAWPAMLGSAGNADKSSLTGNASAGECVKEDMLIKDYLPAMKAVCDKLEEADEKVLVVSDIKLALGYKKRRGHRTWRTVMNRLEDAGLVEKIQAEVNKKDVKCLRLLKKFDSRDFHSKRILSEYDLLDSDNLVKHGKRGEITDQFLELPMEHRIYDMIDAEGPKGITIHEVCKRLGFSPKKMYNRIIGMCSRFGMCMESEKPNKTQLYRIWTRRNYLQYSINVSSGNCEEVPVKNRPSTNSSDMVLYDQSSSDAQLMDSSIQDKDLHSVKTYSAPKGLQPPQTCNGSLDVVDEFSIAYNDAKLVTTESAMETNVDSSERPLKVSNTTSKQSHWYRSVSATVLGAKREQLILERLEIVGFGREIDDIVHRCKLGLRLMDLPNREDKRLLDDLATERLSRLINTLLLLKLIKLVRQGPANVELPPHDTPTHAMELEPYIEEPLPRVLPPLKINSSDLRPRIRHDFVFSDIEDVNAYWETLEYCYAAADQVSASIAFPGSVIREVSSARSWASVRVMTAEQREELLKRMEFDDLEKKIPFKKCVEIARELNLSVEQVLRVSYDKQRRIQRDCINSEFKEQESYVNANINGSSLGKRKFSKFQSVDHIQNDAETGAAHSTMENDTKILDNPLEACRVNSEENSAIECEPHGEDNQMNSFSSCSDFLKPKPTRRRMFLWSDKSDRQLIMQYARYRVTMGDRFHRVIWTSVSDLPTHPDKCRKRMGVLRSDDSIRRAVMRLCNLLMERYGQYLTNAWRTLETKNPGRDDSLKSLHGTIVEETDDQNVPAFQKDSYETNFQQNSWDNFEDPDLKMAVDEVLRCKRMAKLEYPKRHGLSHGKCWPDTPNNGTNLDIQERVNTGDKNDSLGETRNTTSNILQTTGQSKSKSHQSHKKFTKLLDSRRIGIRRQVCESITVANAVELLKLVFLSNSATAEVQASLAATLQLYSKCDLLAAFNYLKEREFVVTRNGGQSPVLSQKFWHNASSSPFPIDSGKRAASFSSWLHKQDNNLEDGLDLSIDIQCGEIFHLFALVSSEEVIISPCLPEDGIGEAEESKTSQSFKNMDDEIKALKRKSDSVEKPSSGEKGKKQKVQGKLDVDFCARREKGFPGIKVFLNRAIIPTYEEMNRGKYFDKETISFASSSSNFRLSENVCSENQLKSSLNESQWDNLSKYAALWSSRFVGRNEVSTLCPEVFKSVYSSIDQAGEQGLSIEEILTATGIQGVQFAEVVVDTLEIFKLAIKVNAYDCIRVVASSYRSMYFIGMRADHNQSNFMATYMRSYSLNSNKDHQLSRPRHENDCNSQNDTIMNISDRHKVTLLDLPEKNGPLQGEMKMNEECSVDKSKQGDAVSLNQNDTDVHCSILPWINGDGSTNTIVYKGLTRRVLGTVMQNPGIIEEDIIRKMDVLNPQSCRRLLETMILDNHIILRMMPQTTTAAAPPSILQSLFNSNVTKPKSEFRKHYFANPMSTTLL